MFKCVSLRCGSALFLGRILYGYVRTSDSRLALQTQLKETQQLLEREKIIQDKLKLRQTDTLRSLRSVPPSAPLAPAASPSARPHLSRPAPDPHHARSVCCSSRPSVACLSFYATPISDGVACCSSVHYEALFLEHDISATELEMLTTIRSVRSRRASQMTDCSPRSSIRGSLGRPESSLGSPLTAQQMASLAQDLSAEENQS